MARCRNCGCDPYPQTVLCYKCRKKWIARRMEIWNEALEKYGKLSADNLKDIQKYVKKQEKARPLKTWEPNPERLVPK